MDDALQEPAATDPADAADLRRAVAVLAGEVQTLADRVARLSHAVDALSPVGDSAAPAPDRSAEVPTPPESTKEPERFRVVVSPVSELALAAVAETSLRSLPGVVRVIEVTRSESEVRFELEIQPDFDLVEPLRSALPVPFDITAAGDDEMVITLRPAWGSAASA